MHTPIIVGGKFAMSFKDRLGKPGWSVRFNNGVTLAACDLLGEWIFRGASIPLSWRLGLIDSLGFSGGVAGTDTHSLHPGWQEFTGIQGGTRPGWVPSAAQGGTLLNPAINIIITTNGALRGMFLASDALAGSVSPAATLYSTGAVTAPFSVTSGGVLTVQYLINLVGVS